jgi:hypothetical protein
LQLWISQIIHGEKPRLALVAPFAGLRGDGIPKDFNIHFGRHVVQKFFLVFRLEQQAGPIRLLYG